MKTILKFPLGFYWGAATSSHQIEGGQNNDWSLWEKANANRLAKESEKAFAWNPNWKKFKEDATNPNNYISGTACDSWNRFEEDFNIVNFLGLSAYRFSIEWSRIEPKEGQFDEVAISRYRGMIESLRKRKIEPFVTLWHWTLPIWMAEKGGTLSPEFPEKFARYTEKIVKAFGGKVNFWITLNEPSLQSSFAYLKKTWPPQKRCPRYYFRALKNLATAHKRSFEIIKKANQKNQVGIAEHQVYYEMVQPTFINKILKKVADYFGNGFFLRKIKNYQDFIGLNFYNRNVINNGFKKNPNQEITDFGWEFHPDSIYNTLVELKKYNKPIYITENGLADANDLLREKFIVRTLAAVHRAILAGVPVKGYFYWSLLDNFEWDKGFWLRFGLTKVDFRTKERTVRDSAFIYKTVAEDNELVI